jgi:NAD(P)-dependent dehydrogenase (short-subunit alcohol dehydrogenase family)
MKGQTVLVTGATSGIGFHTARGLAARGAHVLVTGRDPGRGLRVIEDLRRVAGHSEVEFLDADHATVGGNQRLARRVSERIHRLDVLVNNVGGLFVERRLTADGYEETLAANAVGPFALTQALLPLLQAAGRSRVVNVVSSAHALWRGDPFADVPGGAVRHVGLEVHARAKLLALLWTFAFARRPEARRIAVNATNPGMAWTPGTRALTRQSVPQWRYVWPLVRLVQRCASAARAARAPIHLASSPDVAGTSGQYFESGGQPATPSAAARDPRSQDRAWRLLSDLVEHAPTAFDRSGIALHPPSVVGDPRNSEDVSA